MNKNQELIEEIRKRKLRLTPDDLCCTEESKGLIPFIEEVEKLKFEEKPDYNKLHFYLVKILLCDNTLPREHVLNQKSTSE